MNTFARSIYDFLRTIPKGKVVTYGQLARAIGSPCAARAVGNVLHANPDPDYYPCYKVVDREGRLAEHFALGIDEQKRRLEADGIVVDGYKVDLEKYQDEYI